jgi:hypothetical protein
MYVKVQSSVWRFQNIDPPPSFHPASVSPPPATKVGVHSRRAVGGGGIILKTPDIGLASYSIISLRLQYSNLLCLTKDWKRPIHGAEGAVVPGLEPGTAAAKGRRSGTAAVGRQASQSSSSSSSSCSRRESQVRGSRESAEVTFLWLAVNFHSQILIIEAVFL